MRNIRLLISYDGTGYEGWERQKEGKRTIQGEIEGALAKLHKHPVQLIGSGRTDSGVHALGQVANFHTDIEGMEDYRFVRALNSNIGHDIIIREAREEGGDFHARFDARSRTYRYYFIYGREALPMERRYALQLRKIPPLEVLNSYARTLLGERDCTLFSHARDSSKTRKRYIHRCAFFWDRFFMGDALVLEVSANAFLWRMVRSLAGTLLNCGLKGYSDEAFRDLVEGGERGKAGPTLPPQGLFLWHIDYYRGRGK